MTVENSRVPMVRLIVGPMTAHIAARLTGQVVAATGNRSSVRPGGAASMLLVPADTAGEPALCTQAVKEFATAG